MENQKLRELVKQISEQKGINLNYFAKQIGFKNVNSFHNFLCGSKGLSEEKQKLLKEEIRRFV